MTVLQTVILVSKKFKSFFTKLVETFHVPQTPLYSMYNVHLKWYKFPGTPRRPAILGHQREGLEQDSQLSKKSERTLW